MHLNNTQTLLAIAVIACITALTRFFPFILFSGKKTPQYILWLGRVLPYAIMGMLVVYCLKGVNVTSAPYGIPELVGCAVAIALQVLKRNSILSISVSTALYVLIVG